MMKIKYVFFIILIMISIKQVGASNPVLQLDEDEIDGRSFGRVYNKLKNFYYTNADQIEILNAQKFFEDPKHPTPLAIKALQEIKKNRKAAITHDYFKKYQLLKTHLLRIYGCFKEDKTADDLEPNKVVDLINYTVGLIYMLSVPGFK